MNHGTEIEASAKQTDSHIVLTECFNLITIFHNRARFLKKVSFSYRTNGCFTSITRLATAAFFTVHNITGGDHKSYDM